MDFTTTEEQDELRSSVREILEQECPPAVVRRVHETGEPATGLWNSMVELGWPALAVAEEDGGLGFGFVELALVLEEMGRHLVPGPFLATVSQFAPLVREAGSSEQRKRFLSGTATGEVVGTLALAEERGTWDPHTVEATARRQGDQWVLEGVKRHVVEATAANELAVVARTDAGLGAFVVPTEQVAVTPIEALDPSRTLASIDLGGARLEADRALGTPGEVDDAIRRAVEEATVAVAADIVGTCQSIFDQTLEYAKVREQFDVPIGSFQAIKHKFANLLIALEKARAAVYWATLTVAEDDPDRRHAASMAKAAAGECEALHAKEGIQIHGGIGYTWEHDVHLYVKRVKSAGQLFDSVTTHRQRIAGLLGV